MKDRVFVKFFGFFLILVLCIGALAACAGSDGQNGVDGRDGRSAFELFMERFPDYEGDEEQWLDDLLNGVFVVPPVYHTVEFVIFGEVVKVIQVRHGERIARPQFPEGYGTQGWFFRYFEYFSDCDEQYPGGFYCEDVMWVWVISVVVGDITLYNDNFFDWSLYDYCDCVWCT
jgi:hypothetical protein